MNLHSSAGCIRPAADTDIPALLDIYTPFVTRTAVTFEITPPSPQEILHRLHNILGSYPWLVCEIGGHVVGYAYAARIFEREAFGWDCETFVYVAPTHQRRGAARALYQALLELLRCQGCRNAYAKITFPNEAVLELHRMFGFTQAGVLRRTGYKLGTWHDLILLEKALLPLSEPVIPMKRPDELSRQTVQRVLDEAARMLLPSPTPLDRKVRETH